MLWGERGRAASDGPAVEVEHASGGTVRLGLKLAWTWSYMWLSSPLYITKVAVATGKNPACGQRQTSLTPRKNEREWRVCEGIVGNATRELLEVRTTVRPWGINTLLPCRGHAAARGTRESVPWRYVGVLRQSSPRSEGTRVCGPPLVSVPKTGWTASRLADAMLAVPGWARRVRADVLARNGRPQSSWGKVTESRERGLDGSDLAGARSRARVSRQSAGQAQGAGRDKRPTLARRRRGARGWRTGARAEIHRVRSSQSKTANAAKCAGGRWEEPSQARAKSSASADHW